MYYLPEYTVIRVYKDQELHIHGAQYHKLLKVEDLKNRTFQNCLIVTSLNLPYNIIAELGFHTRIYIVKNVSISELSSLLNGELVKS